MAAFYPFGITSSSWNRGSDALNPICRHGVKVTEQSVLDLRFSVGGKKVPLESVDRHLRMGIELAS
jgi:hypothetical protein